jgi:hypothetical protein
VAGIISHGACMTLCRPAGDAIGKAWGSGSIRGQRSVANNDEDGVTWHITDSRWFPSGRCGSSAGQRVRLSLTKFLNGGRTYG